nr:hypothetical protein [Tanacetum cinerariifolium]
METTRRSLKRQQKIPNHFHDFVHDLNKKKEYTNNKGTSMKEKKVGDCLDIADKECLGEDVNQGSMFDGMVDSQQSVSGNVRDYATKENELKPCSDKGCDVDNKGYENSDKGVNTNVDKVMFGSVNDAVLVRNEGSNSLKLPTVSNLTPNANPKMSYARASNKLENLIDNKLINVPTNIDELGNEFVVFDKELINDGSRRWQLTLIRYARVLINVSAKKGLFEKFDIIYKNATKEIIEQKTVKVIYDWGPSVCSDCGMFGHSMQTCHKSAIAANDKHLNNACKVQLGKQQHDEFTEVTYKRVGKQNTNKSKNTWVKQQTTKSDVNVGGLNSSKTVYQPKYSSNNGIEKMEGKNTDVIKETSDAQEGTKYMNDRTPKKGKGKRDKHGSPIVQDYNRSANKYSVLETLDEEGKVYEMDMSSSTKQDELINLIVAKKLNIGVILETHLKSNMLDK